MYYARFLDRCEWRCLCACNAEPSEKPATPSEPHFEQPKPGRQMRDRMRPPRAGYVPSGNRNSAS